MNQNISSLLQRVSPWHAQVLVRSAPQTLRRRQSQRRHVLQRWTRVEQQRRAYASYDPFAFGASEKSQRSNDGAQTRSSDESGIESETSSDVIDNENTQRELSTSSHDAVHQYSPYAAELQTKEQESNDIYASSPSAQTFADIAGLNNRNSDHLNHERHEDDTDSESVISSQDAQYASTFAPMAPEEMSIDFDSTYLKLFRLDYRTQLPLALARKEPDLATRCIFAAHNANDTGFIQSISGPDFSAVLDLLKPSNFLHDLIYIHYSMSNAVVNNFGLKPMDRIAKDYGAVMRRLMDVRHYAGLPLTLHDYEAILGAAKDLQLAGLAGRAWYYLSTDGHKPNIKTYNSWISAQCYLGPKSAANRHQERVYPHNMRWRRAAWLHRAVFTFRVGDNGIVSNSEKLFADMQRESIQPDEESYCILIAAYALEGRIDGVAAMLNNIWKIDVELIMSGTDQGSPRMFDASDPLRPSKRLLFAATKAYCINNDLPTAVNLLMYLCRHYEIEVDEEQWTLLLEWVYVLSRPRKFSERQEGKAQGKLDIGTMLALWKTMVSPPYNIEPSSGMFDLLIRNLRFRDDQDDAMLEAMEAGRAQYREQAENRAARWRDVERLLLDKGAMSERAEVSIEHAVRAWELAKLRCVLDHNFLRTWLHHFLIHSEMFALKDFDAQRTARDIPMLLERWRKFAPRVVHYNIPTGHVELLFGSPERSAAHKEAQIAYNAHRQKLLANVSERIDQSWIINYDAPDHVRAQGWQHNQSRDLDHAHKRKRGQRRPSEEFLSSLRRALFDDRREVEDETKSEEQSR
ncbi:hypothetical protein AMS68_000170 [Peltaster fructicola]|uniref:ATPase expression protein 2, mitochondrial n=1 Tax=Peltaster fructicola TaxID=286661 RepID=A0A6H0XIV1_9PEZI|nr:hypothetical protein AMS68_000170 [Peltaster fructicola]